MRSIRGPFCKPLSISVLWVAMLLGTAVQAIEPAKQLNVLFVMADDLNTRIGCYGDPLVKTPNIDRLPRVGLALIVLTASSRYVPSRNSMLTGLYPDSTGIFCQFANFPSNDPGPHQLAASVSQRRLLRGPRR